MGGAAAKDASKAKASGGAPIERHVSAVIRALLAIECQDRQEAPTKYAQSLEHLSGMSQALTRLANNAGRLPLAFASSSCAAWCALNLIDDASLKLREAQPDDLLKELEGPAAGAAGQLPRRARLLAQYGKAAQRLFRALADHPNHRRRFLRFMGNIGASDASESDLRLLLLPPNATPGELAGHIRRLSSLVDKNVVLVPSRKRGRPPEG